MTIEHPGLQWAREQGEQEERERLARVAPPPSRAEILAGLHLAGVRAPTAQTVVEAADAFLATRPAARMRDVIGLTADFGARLEQRYDRTWHELARAGRGVKDLHQLLAALLGERGAAA